MDVISQSKIREFVKHYNNEYKTTFVITSHYTQDIQEMCKRVHILNKGESVYDGDFSELIKSNVDILFANEDEINAMFQVSDIKDSIKHLKQMIIISAIT